MRESEAEVEADGSSHAGSAFPDGLLHTASAPGNYHYFVVSSPLDALSI